MLYCRLVEKNDNSVTYKYGGSIDDITGLLTFNYIDGIITIINRQTGDSIVFDKHIQSLFRKNQDNFKAGEFPERLSWVTH